MRYKNLDSKEIRVLILSAGKIDSELEKIFGKIPSGLNVKKLEIAETSKMIISGIVAR